jgi:hypothetical protein
VVVLFQPDTPGGTTAGLTTSFAATNLQLGVLGQTLQGDFTFDKITTGANAGALKVTAANVALGLGDGTTDFVSVTNGSGAFVLTNTGLAGKLAATVELNVPDVEFVGTFGVEINNTGAAVGRCRARPELARRAVSESHRHAGHAESRRPGTHRQIRLRADHASRRRKDHADRAERRDT